MEEKSSKCGTEYEDLLVTVILLIHVTKSLMFVKTVEAILSFVERG